MTTTARVRPTINLRVAKGAETPLSRMVEARRAAADAPVKAARLRAVKRVDSAARLADAARIVVLARADLIDWERLPQSFQYRAEVRNMLDALCRHLEHLYADAHAAAAHFDADAHPIAHAHFLDVALAAWRERARWAQLRCDVQVAGR